MGDTKTMSKDNEGIDKTLRDNKGIGKAWVITKKH
jgi:hypothetical protein